MSGHPAASGRSPDERLALRRNPVSLALTPGLWAAVWYLLSYLVLGWILFSVVFSTLAVSATLAITLAGLPMLVASAWLIRGCANVERVRLRALYRQPVRGHYRTSRPGITARVGVRWRDPATWRDVAYLVGLWAPLTILDAAVATVWLVLLAGITMPLWYWAPMNSCVGYCAAAHARGVQLGYFPHGPNGPGASGLYVDTLPKALLVTAVSLIPFLLFNYLVVATARAHGRTARALLRPPADPLAEAKRVLTGPGPLPPLTPKPHDRTA